MVHLAGAVPWLKTRSGGALKAAEKKLLNENGLGNTTVTVHRRDLNEENNDVKFSVKKNYKQALIVSINSLDETSMSSDIELHFVNEVLFNEKNGNK